jgi:hypothetical protein
MGAIFRAMALVAAPDSVGDDPFFLSALSAYRFFLRGHASQIRRFSSEHQIGHLF